MSRAAPDMLRLINPDAADARDFWRDKEWKKWAVDVTAGPAKRPTFRQTIYVRARSAQRAVACARANMHKRPPRGAVFSARLAGPRELGCVPTPARCPAPGADIAPANPRPDHGG
jgi:hypothetical protein